MNFKSINTYDAKIKSITALINAPQFIVEEY